MQGEKDWRSLRGGLFTPKQLERHARILALGHREVTSGKSDYLLQRLKTNGAVLQNFNSKTLALKNISPVPAAEWLTDNFYLIEEHIRLAHRHFSRKYSRELPSLKEERFKGLPRVYALAVEFLSHTDARVEMELLSSFLQTYQAETKLKIGELWAIPIMLRLALIDNLQHIATRLLENRKERQEARQWLTRLNDTAEEHPSRMVTVLAELSKSGRFLSPAFVSEFSQNLSSPNAALQMARKWLEQRLAEEGFSIEEAIRQESRTQAADQVTVSHSIGSLRLLGTADWKTFVESLSAVDAILREDPGQVYALSDFTTRDACRHAVEKLAKRCGLTEEEVARQALALARKPCSDTSPERESHVAFFLLDDGCSALERAVGARSSWGSVVEGFVRRFPLAFYLGGITALTLSGVAVFMTLAGLTLSNPGAFILAALFGLGFSQIAVALVNWLAMLMLRPRLLPRIDFPDGVFPEYRTVVVVPAMLSGKKTVRDLLETLEFHYLSNRDPHIHFALLTDFVDAPRKEMPDDEERLELVAAGVRELNERYAPGLDDRFFLFHRPRLHNASEGVWMGRERKRGKLMDFNAFLRGGGADAFSRIEGDVSRLGRVRYVITLDADTQFPPQAARKLIGTMAHPLNRPEIDPRRNVVVRGYGVLQPRVVSNLLGVHSSVFARLFAGDGGVDLYTLAVSDVYQDLFGEGSFVGKGIYDVDVFLRTLGDRLPENRILSHDLLEAAYTRSGFVSDIRLYEGYPDGYDTDAKRRHRWMRGDWQIAQWLFPGVPGRGNLSEANPVSGLYKWKIFDNLRRSLVAPSLLLFLALSPVFLASNAWIAVILVPAAVALPILLNASGEACRKARDCPLYLHIREIVQKCGRQLAQVFISLVFLPYEAYLCTDAVIRTLYRLLITRKNLLEWQSCADAARFACGTLFDFYLRMGFAPLFALAFGGVLFFAYPSAFFRFMPFWGAWLAAPAIAWLMSRPRRVSRSDFSDEQKRMLHRIACRTWHFFETFVTEEENWLPPDNYQEYPNPVVASRTSPTNIGLALLANLGAADLGYLSVGRLLERTRRTLATTEGLEKFRGHLYNWYDTRTLRPLGPLYVSTVDSGNLAGHLLTLAGGLKELWDAPAFSPSLFSALLDTVRVLRRFAPDSAVAEHFEKRLEEDVPQNLPEIWDLLRSLSLEAEKLLSFIPKDAGEAHRWGETLVRLCGEHLEEMEYLLPWLKDKETLPEIPQEWNLRVPTLRELAESSARDVSQRASERMKDVEKLAERCEKLAQMDFAFLYDESKKLFSIGYNISEHRPDAGVYDLLASEARLASYVAIAQGQVSPEHWFSLSRLLIAVNGRPVLQSWSGSMFEYLMPLLVMPSYEDALLDHACRGAVEEQIRYGRRFGVPWGISESAYNRTDTKLNYQYKAFGIPSLGLRRGLSSELVIAPYATVMALMVAPLKACENLQRLSLEGYEGAYGYYEAIDYTPSRLPPDQTSEPIRSFMAHHQGMSMLALANLMTENAMQRRFMSCPAFRAVDLLLQERISRNIAANAIPDDSGFEIEGHHPLETDASNAMRVFKNTDIYPEVHLLSNGRYHVMIDNNGGGYSRWNGLALTRWREDATCGGGGLFVLVRDRNSGEFWSTAYQPTLHAAKGYEAIFTQARAEFRQRCSGIEMHTVVSVSPEDDVELRCVTLVNRSGVTRDLELTTYAEIVLAPQPDDEAHPAFSNLFVQTEFNPRRSAVLCTRRARKRGDRSPYVVHMLTGGAEETDLSYETDRARFIGRGNSPGRPAALLEAGPLSNGVGSVLDPIAALRRPLVLPAGGSATVYVVLGVAETRGGALALAGKYRDARIAEHALELAWTHSQVVLNQLNITEAEAQLYGRLAGALVYVHPLRRAPAAVLKNNRQKQSNLWRYGIPGDYPLVLLRVTDAEGLALVRQLVAAHAYWRMKGLPVELVILNEDSSVYRASLHESIVSLVQAGLESPMLDRPEGIFVRRAEEIAHEDIVLLQAVARIVLDQADGPLSARTARSPLPAQYLPELQKLQSFPDTEPANEEPPSRELLFDNGLGGFTPDGREYVITLRSGQTTPAPWCNVLANDRFGSVVSESGIAYTWGGNAHAFRLTPWSNDPVRDPPGEAFYIRDEETGRFWSPTPQPARGETPYTVRHGFGYSVFEHTEYGIHSELWVYVAPVDPVKHSVLKLRNLSERQRRLSVTGYCEWVLADTRSKSLMHVQTETEPRTGALIARNPYRPGYAGESVFFNIAGVENGMYSLSGDRREFIGQNGNLSSPRAMRYARLSGKTGAGFDPCGALQVSFVLPEKEEQEIRFSLGVARNRDEAQVLASRSQSDESTRFELEKVWEYWNRTLGTVNADTPDPSVNVSANGWLLYQTLACRVRARSAFYQSGGAYGFRDQLQDSMALIHAEPAVARSQILLSAGRQFREGDVQHWWHPPEGNGVRTRISDDYLWLPYATCRYVFGTGDAGILDEAIPFIEGRSLRPDEESCYDRPVRSEETASLYEHCVRSIEHGLRFGEHGLPLMGAGDWNDGMNRVGIDGRGESVWLAFFLYDTLVRFADLARLRDDEPFAERCEAQAGELKENIERHAWDGAWYRRAYFDDGRPLGSADNKECRIDALPQSWGVISGVAAEERVRSAMEQVDRQLVNREDRLIRLFTPPFDRSNLDPGYIRGYVPGVRENGGQYTHGAVWTVMAFALMGETERAWELFDLINPVRHGDTPEKTALYRVEPYVVAADVYSVSPHAGRGGWSWYTGSAAWMYRLLVETLLGVNRVGEALHLVPRMPESWSGYKVHYRYGQTVYHIEFVRSGEGISSSLALDGRELSDAAKLPLTDDGREHFVVMRVGKRA